MDNQSCYPSASIKKSLFSLFALAPPAFLQLPNEMDQTAQEVREYERNSCTGTTVRTPDKDISDTLEGMAYSSYCGVGSATITENDRTSCSL